MGQIPKNIIYAEAGTKLRFNVDGKDIDLDENTIDAMAAEEGNKLVQSGELRQTDLPKFMSTYSTFKNQAKTGKYKLDTAGTGMLTSMGYEAPGSTVGSNVKGQSDLGFDSNGEVAQRTGVGRFLARQGLQSAIKPKEENMMARLNNVLGARIGGMALGENAKVQKTADDLKAKTEGEAKALADAQTKKYAGDIEQFQGYFNDQTGGVSDNDEVVKAMSPEDRLKYAKGYFDKVYPDLKKYDRFKNTDLSDIETQRTSGKMDSDFFTNFYGRLYGDPGRVFMQKYFGNTLQTQEAKVADEAHKASLEAIKNDQIADPNYYNVGNNNISKKPDFNHNGINYHIEYTIDPKTGKSIIQYVGLPEELESAKPDALFTELNKAPRLQVIPGDNGEILLKDSTGKIIHIPPTGSGIHKKQINQPLPSFVGAESLTNIAPSLKNVPFIEDSTPTPTVKKETRIGGKDDWVNTYIHNALGMRKKGGTIDFMQSGGSFEENLQKRLADHAKYVASQQTSETPEAPIETFKDSESPASQVVERVQGKSLKGAPSIKTLYNAAEGEGELSTSDKLDAAALAADIAGLGIGLTTGEIGGSIVSSALGFGSTGASAYADYLREGKMTAGNIGRTALSGLADAATLVPFLGEAAQGWKIAKALPKIGKILKYTGYAGMAAGGKELVEDLVSGDKSITDLNTNDLRMIVGGLRMASAGKTIGKAVKTQPVSEFQGKVINADGEAVPATFAKQEDGSYTPKDAAQANMKPVMGRTLTSPFTKKIIGSGGTEVVATPEESTATSMLGNAAERRRNSLRWGLNKEDRLNEIYELMGSRQAKNLEILNTKRVPGSPPPTNMTASSPLKEPIVPKAPIDKSTPTITRSNKNVPPLPTEKKVFPTTDELAKDISQMPLSPKIQEILDRVSKTVPTTSNLGKSTISIPEVETIPTSTSVPAKKVAKVTTTPKNPTRPKIVAKVTEPKVEPQKVESKTPKFSENNTPSWKKVSKKFKGGILKADGGAVLGTPYTPESSRNPFEEMVDLPWFQRAMGSTKYVAPIPDGASRIANPISSMSNSFNRLKPIQSPVGSTKVAQAGAQNAGTGFLSKMQTGLGSKSGIQGAEFFRTLLANKATQNIDTRVEAPLVQPAASTSTSVRGDLQTKSAYYDRANKIRGSFVAGSDPVRNAMMKRQLDSQASQLEEQGDQADSQMRQNTQGQQTENTQRDSAARAEVAARNQSSLASAVQGQRQGENAKQSQIANNWDAFLSSQTMQSKADLDRKTAMDKDFRTRNLQRTLDMKYPNLSWRAYQARLTPGGITPEISSDLQKYQDELDAGSRQIAFSKEGGSIEKEQNKADLALYKSRSKSNVYDSQIGNKWLNKQDENATKFSIIASKKLTDYISKILK